MEKEATKVYGNLLTYAELAEPLPKGDRMKPIVSVGMCLRNNEKTLRDTINSVIKQDFPHELMEMIVVDGCSQDQTLSIIKETLSKADIKVRIFSENKGLGFARNIVFNNANGEYIIWVDGDQILPADYVRKQVEFMNHNPSVGITAGIIGILPGNPILTLELIPAIIDRMRMRNRQPRSFLWKTERLIGDGGATFRVNALRQVNGFDSHLNAGMDQDVARRIKDAGWLIRLNSAIFYELHGGMSTLKDLCNKYIWYGDGLQSLYRKNRKLFSLPRMCPPAGFIAGFLYSLIAYKVLHRKMVFLLPFHFALKMTAWSLGFIKSQITHHKEG